MLRGWVLAVMLALFGLIAPQPWPPRSALPLIIGNDSYERPAAAEKGRNDASAVADTLQGIGFDVDLLQMRTAGR